MTNREKLEMKQAELKKQVQANAKLLKQMARAEREEVERKAYEEKVQKAFELYDYCMSHDIIIKDEPAGLLYDWVWRRRVVPHDPSMRESAGSAEGVEGDAVPSQV